MTTQSNEENRFNLALEQEREEREKQLIEHPEKEINRLKWLKYKHTIEAEWLPVMDEYLNVLGKLWFGYKMRLKGPIYRKQLFQFPAYVVGYRVYGPTAIFWVEVDEWEERETPYSVDESRIELFKRGYRCRVVSMEDSIFNLQDDAHNNLLEFVNGYQIKRKELRTLLKDIFSDAYIIGAKEIYKRWKDFGIGRINSDEYLPEI